MIYYTVKDIEIITGLDEEEVIIIIKRLNEEIKEKTGRSVFDYIIIDDALENVDMKDIKVAILKAGLQFKELAYRILEKEWEIIKY